MPNTDQPTIIALLGTIGAGKTYFTRHLAAETQTVRLNADSLRLAWYGSLEEIVQANGHRAENIKRLSRVIDVVVRAVLAAGQNIILDMAQFNKAERRQQLHELAAECGARVILVWIQTPRDMVIDRVKNRDQRDDQRRIEPEETQAILKDHDKGFAPPTKDEFVIEIDGTKPFEEQYAVFREQLSRR